LLLPQEGSSREPQQANESRVLQLCPGDDREVEHCFRALDEIALIVSCNWRRVVAHAVYPAPATCCGLRSPTILAPAPHHREVRAGERITVGQAVRVVKLFGRPGPRAEADVVPLSNAERRRAAPGSACGLRRHRAVSCSDARSRPPVHRNLTAGIWKGYRVVGVEPPPAGARWRKDGNEICRYPDPKSALGFVRWTPDTRPA
jgi:hypothetical protein